MPGRRVLRTCSFIHPHRCLRWIPPGRFLMGSPETETHGLVTNDDERQLFEREHPQHEVSYRPSERTINDDSCTTPVTLG